MQSFKRESPDGERAAKRARASRPKVKSGCTTCKNRRVKCDETKPECLRCFRFGRHCDGYVGASTGRPVAMIPIKPRIPSAILSSPSVSVYATEEEYRYFQIFRERTSHELSGFFNNDFWTNLVLQESQATTPIRHAVIAMGALTKSLESAPGPQLKVNVIQTVDRRHHENAVVHSLKAIQALNQYISTSTSPQLRVALISCLLFVAFETFQGSFASSVQQTYGGLKILRSYYVGKPGSRPWIPRRAVSDSGSTSEKVSKVLQVRPGCDNVSKARAMAVHLEEYLASENDFTPELEDSLISKRQIHAIDTARSPLAMARADLASGQRRPIMPLPARQHPSSRTSSSTQERKTASSQRASERSQLPVAQKSPASDPAVPIPTTHAPVSRLSSASSRSSANKQPSMSQKRPLASQKPSPPKLQNDHTIEEALIQTFVRLDGQGLFFGMIPGIPPLIWDIHKLQHLPIPERFTDFPSAHRCWDFLQDRALQFYRRVLFNRAYAPGNCETPAQVARQHASFVKQLSEFEKAFKHILREAVDPTGQVRNPAALIISLYQKITLITIAAVRTDSEMIYDAFLPEFQYILRTCHVLLASQDAAATARNARFSLEVGVVPPLHITATKCRDPIIRREAIDLLFASPRQEGMWDGVLTARIGTWLTSCEEDGLSPPPLESRESSVSRVPSESDLLALDRLSYPSPPQIVDDLGAVGGEEGGTSISRGFNETVVGGGLTEYASTVEGGTATNSVGLRPGAAIGGLTRRRKQSTIKREVGGAHEKGWKVPEENRVQLMVVDFHISDRYIKVKCQKALLREDGSREERETVIAW